MIYSKQELVSTLNLLNSSEIFQEAYSENKNFKRLLNIIELFIYFGLFYISSNLQAWNLVIPIMEEYNGFLDGLNNEKGKDLFLNDKKVDFLFFFNDLKKKTETLGDLKQKSHKANKNLDIIAEAFPDNPYQKQEIIKHEIIEEIDPKINIFQTLVRYLAAFHFSKITIKQFEKVSSTKFESNIYNKNKFSLESVIYFCSAYSEKMYKTFKSLLYKLSIIDINVFVEEIKGILNVLKKFTSFFK